MFAPVKAGVLVEVALAFEELKVRSVVLPEVTFAVQLELVLKLPPPAPVHVCARAGSVNRANAARAKKTVQKICPEEKDREFFIFGELEFYDICWGKENGSDHA